MPTPSRILIIDDDAVDRQAVKRALGASDSIWDLTEAASAAEGLALARETSFDCVLLDYRLPDADAFDVLAQLMSPAGGGHAVLILTGEANPDTALELMRAGALDHLSKGELKASGLSRAIRYAKARRGFLDELEEAKRQAEETALELEVLNRQKSLLLSIIAHDLRNPFQILLGMSDFLSQAVAQKDSAKIEVRAQGLRQAAGDAHTLLESLLNWAKLQMDSGELVLEVLDLGAVAAEAAVGCRGSAEAKAIALDIECNGLHVDAHRDMLATILRNLIGNAIKFTPPAGRIAVTAAESDMGDVSVAVSDTGVGMTPAVLGDLFQIDRRMTTPGTAGEKGSGLGLLLCHDLAERMGATLSVESALNEGTSFTITFGKSATAADNTPVGSDA